MRSQTRTYSLSLYYNINESVSEQNNKRTDSLLKAVGSSTMQIKLYAYADFLSDNAYNLNLSKRRLDAVKQQIQSKKDLSVIFEEVKAYGEEYSKDNQSLEGEASQRRVDIIISVKEERKRIGQTPKETQAVKENKPKEKPAKKNSPAKETTVFQKNIEEMKEGETLAIEGLSFIPGRHILMKSSIPVLEELLETLKQNPELKIEVQGHICCLPPGEQDGVDLDTGELNLSESRAEAVYNYLVRNGIEKERLTYKGYGHLYPKIKIEQTPEDEQANRRVEIKILEN